MRVTSKGATLISGEGSCPPLPYLDLDDDTALAMIGLGVAIEVVEDGAEPVEAAAVPVVEPEAAIEPAPEPVIAGGASGEPGTDEPDPVAGDPAADAVSDPDAERKSDIDAAILLLDADDFVKTGERAGKPKVAPVIAILGYDVTAAEVDAVFDHSET